MIRKQLASALLTVVAAMWLGTGAAFALPTDDPSLSASVSASQSRWTAHGFNVAAPSTVWPMLELLKQHKFDWALSAASQGQVQIVWAELPSGTYGRYLPAKKLVELSTVLQTSSVEAGTAFLAHELTHLNDDLNGLVGQNLNVADCYAAETRAFVNETNFWSMVFGRDGKLKPDAIEAKENSKMRAFVGRAGYVETVVRTTESYVRQCGR